MGRTRLKTKLVLAITGMVVALVATFSYFYVSRMVRQRIYEAYDSADFIAKEIRESARQASQIDLTTTLINQNDPQELKHALEQALKSDTGLNTLLQSVVGFSPTVSDAAIADVNGRAIVDTDATALGAKLEQRRDFDELRAGSFFQQLKVVFGVPRVYNVYLPIQREGKPFGDIRVGISTVLLQNEVQPQLVRALYFSVVAILIALFVAAGLSNIVLRPLEAIGRRLDQMTVGVADTTPEPDPRYADEYAMVHTKIDRLGRQIRDVKEVFSALKENLDQIMGALQDGLVLFTRDTRVVLVSASAERFIGRPRGDILGNLVEDVFTDATKLGRIVLDSFALQRPIPQREIELENGRRIQIGLDFIAERGERIGALLIMRDAESVRRIESEIELSRRLAAIGRLTSGVAHEVKNPINAIVVHLELLREKMRETDPDTHRHVDIIGREIHRLDRVVQMLVDFNRPVELQLADFDLRKLIEDVVVLASPEAEQQGVNIQTQLAGEALPVRADSDLIKQALLNVVLNGVQAMSTGGTLHVRVKQSDTAATIEVQDEGSGIAPEVRDKVFNLYFTTKKTGSGIGLAMSYRALQLHNGALDFVTEMGRGTTFRLILPMIGAKEHEGEAVTTQT
jgi:signal transduction histidine kinase